MQKGQVNSTEMVSALERHGDKLTPHQRKLVERIASMQGVGDQQVGTVSATPQQLDALHRFAVKHGRTWKCRLVEAWMQGNDDRLPDGGLLRQVRNQLGTKWLRDFRLGVQ